METPNQHHNNKLLNITAGAMLASSVIAGVDAYSSHKEANQLDTRIDTEYVYTTGGYVRDYLKQVDDKEKERDMSIAAGTLTGLGAIAAKSAASKNSVTIRRPQRKES